MWWLLAGCADAPQQERFDPELAAALQEVLDDGRAEVGAPGAAMAVIHPEEGRWTGVSGEAHAGVDVEATDLFRVGSITKMYTAVVVVQLADEGAVSLDDPVGRWVPWAPHPDDITIRHLLNHTSGLPDFASDLEFLGNLDEEWTAEALVALVADDPLLFEPGADFAYSNTGYALLGEVIRAATGRPWGEAVRDRVLAPLALEATYLPSLGPTPPIVSGYSGQPPVDVTDAMSPTAPNAGGELVATADDVASFAQALLVDGVLADVDALTTPPILADGSASPYASGVYLTPRGDDVLMGHSGSTMGFQSRVHVLDGIVVTTVVNHLFAEADMIDAAAWEVLVGPSELR